MFFWSCGYATEGFPWLQCHKCSNYVSWIRHWKSFSTDSQRNLFGTVHIEDCGDWWLFGCCGSVAEHWWLKSEVSLVWLSATAGFFTYLYFHLTLKFISSMRQDALSIGSILRIVFTARQLRQPKCRVVEFSQISPVLICCKWSWLPHTPAFSRWSFTHNCRV